MKSMQKALLSVVAAAAMGLSASAGAHDRHHHQRHWKHDHHHRHGHGHHHDRYAHRPYYASPYLVPERVIVERPVYVAPPAPYYYPPVRRPGWVVSVDVPPIVIPLR